MPSLRALPLCALVASLAPPAAAQQSPGQRLAALRAALVAEVSEQLRSEDLQKVAWGAHTAGELRIEECIPELRSALRWLAAVDPVTRRWAADDVFDALIRTNAVVPGDELRPFLGNQLVQVLVLLCRRFDEDRRLLVEVFERATDDTFRACGELLADARDPGFVRALLQTPLLLTVHVVDPGETAPPLRLPSRVQRPFPFAARWSGRKEPSADDYPPTAVYSLVQQVSADTTPLLAGKSHWFVRRVESPRDSRHVWQPRRFESRAARTAWLARALGPDAGSPFFDFEIHHACDWAGAERFLATVDARRRLMEDDYRALVAECVRTKAVAPDAAEGLSPTVEVRIEDHRKEPRAALPPVR